MDTGSGVGGGDVWFISGDVLCGQVRLGGNSRVGGWFKCGGKGANVGMGGCKGAKGQTLRGRLTESFCNLSLSLEKERAVNSLYHVFALLI